jgi:hypothetical protein
VSVLQVYVVLAQACNPSDSTSCRHRPCHVVPWKIHAPAPMDTMIVEPPGGILFTLIARSSQPLPMGHVVVSELPRALVAGARATRHVAVLELS